MIRKTASYMYTIKMISIPTFLYGSYPTLLDGSYPTLLPQDFHCHFSDSGPHPHPFAHFHIILNWIYLYKMCHHSLRCSLASRSSCILLGNWCIAVHILRDCNYIHLYLKAYYTDKNVTFFSSKMKSQVNKILPWHVLSSEPSSNPKGQRHLNPPIRSKHVWLQPPLPTRHSLKSENGTKFNFFQFLWSLKGVWD